MRVDEHVAEELLMDVLDHLIEAQEDGKDARDFFVDSLEAYADELIANMPTENKRNIILFFTTFVLLFSNLKSKNGKYMYYRDCSAWSDLLLSWELDFSLMA
ncbi:hypothetical protein [Planococcus halocryophilus]|uniref:hypothetical protein n=1 Tax=Planococcus halocryophilus TaxID=1215089 RepID=UPI001F469FD2|nr:hypothetical protein [Planococcus halocryophilus]